MSVPSTVSQDINFEETVDASIETWIFPALYLSVPFHEEMNALRKQMITSDNNDMEEASKHDKPYLLYLIGLEVVEEDGLGYNSLYRRPLHKFYEA